MLDYPRYLRNTVNTMGNDFVFLSYIILILWEKKSTSLMLTSIKLCLS